MNHLFSRRQLLSTAANGFGAVALAALLAEQAVAGNGGESSSNNTGTDSPLAPKPTHFAATAKNIIFLYMDGGPSQIDTFDPKPRLTRDHGKPFAAKMELTQFNDNGHTLGSPWKFKPHSKTGLPVSDLFPFIRECAPELAVIRSLTSNFSEHTSANYFLHTGSGMQGRPSMGAWFGYGLGSECRNLPGFVVLNGGLIPPGGLDNFNNGFLPASYQGTVFKPGAAGVANIKPMEAKVDLQRNKLALLEKLDDGFLQRVAGNDAVEAAIANQELAFRMQAAVPDLLDLKDETVQTKRSYGLEHAYSHTRTFAAQCLVARRLVEQGVRFIELTCPHTGHDRWDQHKDLKKGHEDNARAVDQPIAALLMDLKQRGLLASTLVVWAGEFGRTPFAQGANGRDHNPFGFSVWLAGGGVKGGVIHGATDEFGYKAVDGKCTMHDLHATMLHLLGMEHKQTTYRWGGRDMRLTDVHGEVIREVLA